jgi:DNA-binding GntR family transcriptional regulator
MRIEAARAAVPDPEPRGSVVRTADLGSTGYHRVRDAMRADIVAGAFSHGEWLKLSLLVDRYGLSPAPIREALNQLAAEGLVELLPNRGARVRRINRSFVADLFEIRFALEPLLAERSAEVATEIHVSELEDAQRDYERAIRSKDISQIIQGNHIFHRVLHGVRPNRPAIDLLNQHSALVASVRRHFGIPNQRFETIIAEHRQLIEACRRRDGALANATMRAHIQRSVDELLPRIAE